MKKKKAKGAKDDSEDEDSEDDDLDNLDDDEVSLGSMNEEFAELEEDGGTFMDVLEDENEGIPGKYLIFAVQPFFLILLSDSVHPRLFNGFVINFQDEGKLLAHCLPEILLMFIFINKNMRPKCLQVELLKLP